MESHDKEAHRQVTQPKPDFLHDDRSALTVFNKIVILEILSVVEAEQKAAEDTARGLTIAKVGQREEFVGHRMSSPSSMWMNLARDKLRQAGARVPANASVELSIENNPPEPMSLTMKVLPR